MHTIDLERSIESIWQEVNYLNGPRESFEKVGRHTFVTALRQGLRPDSKVLDFGCGVVRLGFWFIRFLEPQGYYGIEPYAQRIESGLRHLFSPELIAVKKPQFQARADCVMSGFGVKFNYVVARSILTHACPGLFSTMLNEFRKTAADGAAMLATYWTPLPTDRPRPNYTLGDNLPRDDMRFIGNLRYSLPFIQAFAADHHIKVRELREDVVNGQRWLRFELP